VLSLPDHVIWRIGTQFLVQRETRTGSVFALVEATGHVARTFEPRTSSLEDELYRTYFSVADNELREHTAVERMGGPPRISFQTVFAGLVADTSPEAAHFVATALGDDAVVQEEQRIGVLRDAEARIVAIHGALADLGRGEHVARAQAALRRRVEQWADPRAGALLATLVALARDSPHHALAAFANGCLHACFERDVPSLVDGPIVAHALGARCAAHARELAQAAEGQTWVDAHANAAAFHRAAEAIAIAAELLGHCSTTGS
jgi:hypothetical protein